MGYGKIDIHDFYCLKCGERALSCVRPQAHRREKFHRKKLYCPTCGITVNHIEIKSDEEAYNFKQAFKNGEFQEELIISLKECVING
jgi:ribosomal protein S27AE